MPVVHVPVVCLYAGCTCASGLSVCRLYMCQWVCLYAGCTCDSVSVCMPVVHVPVAVCMPVVHVTDVSG